MKIPNSIYGISLKPDQKEIFYQSGSIECPRRFGKSTILASNALNYMLENPDIIQHVSTCNQYNASLILEKIKNGLEITKTGQFNDPFLKALGFDNLSIYKKYPFLNDIVVTHDAVKIKDKIVINCKSEIDFRYYDRILADDYFQLTASQKYRIWKFDKYKFLIGTKYPQNILI